MIQMTIMMIRIVRMDDNHAGKYNRVILVMMEMVAIMKTALPRKAT